MILKLKKFNNFVPRKRKEMREAQMAGPTVKKLSGLSAEV